MLEVARLMILMPFPCQESRLDFVRLNERVRRANVLQSPSNHLHDRSAVYSRLDSGAAQRLGDPIYLRYNPFG